MTDFLHPQDAASTSVQPEPVQVAPDTTSGQDASSSSVNDDKNSISTNAPVEQSGTEKGAIETPADQENAVAASPIKRDFSRIRKNDDDVAEGEEEKVRHVIRKESPLLVHYYQSVFLLLIMLFVASGYFVLNPLIATFKQVNLEVSSTLTQKEGAEAYLASLNRSIKAAETISPETMKRIDEALPKEVNIPVLMKTFLLLAKNNGVKMGSINFSPEQSSADAAGYGGYALATVRASASITAPGYLVMRRYLEDLQKNIRLLDVESIRVDGDEESGEMNYTIELKTYYLQKRADLMPSSGGMIPGGVRAPSAPVNLNDI